MSVRSGSPWTSMSMPRPSWTPMQCAMYASTVPVYCSLSILPALKEARAERRDAVWGKLPIVDVGKAGICNIPIDCIYLTFHVYTNG